MNRVIEGSHQTFWFVLENGIVNVYMTKCLGPVLKTYDFGETTGDELNMLVRERIDLDIDEIRERDRELNR